MRRRQINQLRQAGLIPPIDAVGRQRWELAQAQKSPQEVRAPFIAAIDPVAAVPVATVGGDANEVRSSERNAILSALEDGKATVGDLAAATGMPRNNVDQLVLKLKRAGEIERVSRGIYALSGTPDKNGKSVRNGSETAEDSRFD